MVIPIKDHQSFVSDTTRVVHFGRYHPIDMQKLTDQKAPNHASNSNHLATKSAREVSCYKRIIKIDMQTDK